MLYSNTLNLIQVGGGTQVKQGDLGSKFSYKLANEKDQELDVFDKEVAHINLVLDDKIVFTTTATVDNSTVTFNIDKAIPVGLYFLEIKIRDYIFPSDKQTIIFVQSGAVAYDLKELVPNYDTNMTLKGILSDLSQKGIDISDLKRRIGNANAELIAARNGKSNLKTRIDDLENKTTAQLAKKANKDEVTNVMTPKGTLAYASLPMTGNSVGWYYYCPDGDGTHGAGNYAWNGTSWFFGGTGDEGYNLLKKDIVDLDELFNWGADKTNILNNITPTVGEYVDYNTGGTGHVSTYEWYELSVNEGQTFKYNGNNAHVAFFSEKYTGMTTEYYLSGLLTQENQAFTVPKNAVSMTLSVLIDYNNWLGKGDDEYRENTTLKKECLPKDKKDKKIIVGGSDGTYTNIVKAVKECEENTTIIVRSGVYNLEAQFKEVYGNDFFVNYKGYITDSNFELSGLYLKRGVKLIADSGTVLSFMYSGNNPKVSEEFSPINMTVDNIVDGFIIEVNSNVRYHIHDDFAFMAFMNTNNYGQNEIRNCVFKGNSTAGSVIGGGMGTYCKYIVHDNCFENTIGNALSYHNASFSNAQNFIDIFNNYAETPIKLWWYGDSTKITTALVHNNTASLIECTKIPNYDAPNENIKMKAWNNSIV